MRNDHFLRNQETDTDAIRRNMRRIQRNQLRPTIFDWLLIVACGLVLGCAIANLLALIMPGFIP